MCIVKEELELQGQIEFEKRVNFGADFSHVHRNIHCTEGSEINFKRGRTNISGNKLWMFKVYKNM